MKSFVTYRLFLRNEKEYKKIILSNVIGRFGDSVDAIAYAWMVYDLTDSASWLAIIYAVNAIPTILFQPFAGALVEFFDKKTTVILCDIGRGCIVLCTGLTFLFDVLQPWHLLVLTFLNSCFESLRIPSSLSIIPSVLEKQNYSMGLSLNQSLSRISELIGLGLSGFIVGVCGSAGALIIDAITFFISAFLFCLVKIRKTDQSQNKKKITTKAYFKDFSEGIQYFKINKKVLIICIIGFLLNLTAVPLEKLQVAYVSESLMLGVKSMSMGSIAMTCGLIVGAFMFVFINKVCSNKNILVYGGVLIGFLYFGMMNIGYIPYTLLRLMSYMMVLFLFGFTNSLIGMSVQITFMSNTPADYIGRVGSIFNAMASSAIPVGSLIMAGILPCFSIVQTYFGVGVVTVLIFLFMGRLKPIKTMS